MTKKKPPPATGRGHKRHLLRLEQVKGRTAYTTEAKERVVREVLGGTATVLEASEAYDLTTAQIESWIGQAIAAKLPWALDLVASHVTPSYPRKPPTDGVLERYEPLARTPSDTGMHRVLKEVHKDGGHGGAPLTETDIRRFVSDALADLLVTKRR